ncbi:hypothetical protein [uncultured Desulfobulbus sp.]|uniref:hypothetical protein n=1 Tax=uncultured Desulfobulbus sp. TaxID=239745 RepID=UPI0029C76B57|nr:hypothetical protein [uncultured Desulfobulbus sp.]
MVNSNTKKTCFISIPWRAKRIEWLLQDAIMPTLHDMKWNVIDSKESIPGVSLYDSIVRNIRFADLFVCDVGTRNRNVLYELGMAHAWGIPTIILSEELEDVPFDIASKYSILLYSRDLDQVQLIKARFIGALEYIERQEKSLLTPTYKRYINLNESISIELFSKNLDAVKAFEFSGRLLEALQNISPIRDGRISEVRVGSLGAWIASNLKDVTTLVEKIIFIIPEWKKKTAECVKIEAEAELLLAQAEKTRAEAEEIRRNSIRKDASGLFDLLSQHESIGSTRLTIGNKIKIESDENGRISIGVPKEYEDAQPLEGPRLSTDKGIRER